MPRHPATSLGLLAALCAALLCAPRAAAQPSTAFTYQGALSSAGAPFTGLADLRAELFSTLSGGSPIAPTVNLTNVTVTNGLFTVPLDFGAAFTDGQPRWIEISVRAPAGAGTFTTLAPRQALSPTPLAHGLAGVALARGGPETLDQAQADAAGDASNVGFSPAGTSWQSFTPAVTGSLTKLQVRAMPATVFSSQLLTIRVHLGVGPSGPLLGEFTVTVAESGFNTALRDIPVPGFFVQAGSPYTFVFGGQVLLERASNQTPGASGFLGGSPYNYYFRTFSTPIPSIGASASSAGFASVAGTATTAATATNSTNAVNSVNAVNATNAASVPWSGLTGQAAVSTASIGAGWQMLFNNSTTGFRGGVRLADNGFLELTNSAGSANPSFARLASNGTWSAVSDERLKTDVSPATGLLDAATELRPVTFRWKSGGADDLGLIAQDARRVLPVLVTGDEAAGQLTLNYSQLSVVAIGALQELKARHEAELDRLRAELKKRDAESADLKARLDRLERSLAPGR